MNTTRDSYLRTGNANEYRVRGELGNWWVEGTDANHVWVDAESDTRYPTKSDAISAARELAAINGGRFVS